jgi:hypothetical protein
VVAIKTVLVTDTSATASAGGDARAAELIVTGVYR